MREFATRIPAGKAFQARNYFQTCGFRSSWTSDRSRTSKGKNPKKQEQKVTAGATRPSLDGELPAER